MADFLDYVKWRGDLTIAERPFNEVDSLILTELAYAQLDGIVPEDSGITLREAAQAYVQMGIDQSGLVCDPKRLLAACGESERFGSLRISDYVSLLERDRQVQFSAETWTLGDGTIYVSFRGTDNTLVGWHEDFNFSFMQETPGQEAAADYLRRAIAKTALPVRVGGHSKGGNLAVYAAAYCGSPGRLLTVHTMDGPGFRQEVANSPEMQAVLPRVRLIIPEESVVGIILNNKPEKKVIRSSGTGAFQHDPYTWQVERDSFLPAERQSVASMLMDRTLSQWLDNMDDRQKQTFVTAVFELAGAGGAETLQDISAKKAETVVSVLGALMKMEPGRREDLSSAVGKLVQAGGNALLSNAIQSVQEGTQPTVQQIQDALQKLTDFFKKKDPEETRAGEEKIRQTET